MSLHKIAQQNQVVWGRRWGMGLKAATVDMDAVNVVANGQLTDKENQLE